MAERIISGIQQIGVGVSNVHEAWAWYRKYLGMDIRIFEEEAVAELMLPHTDGKTRKRHAVLAINLRGGGGFEVWQHTERTPMSPTYEFQIGDLGIFSAKLKTNNIEAAYKFYKDNNLNLISEIVHDPLGNKHLYLKDPFGNIFDIIYESSVFKDNEKSYNGGAYGTVIGVSDIEKAFVVYKDILGYDEVVYDKTDVFKDYESLPGGKEKYRRILLKHSSPRIGSFSKLFGPSQIELVQVQDRKARNIFEGRIWGDPGFIHLCFDIHGMNTLRDYCVSKGFPFTVDSAKGFDMGEAAGHFSYIADPDGTLIEFVETHKLPIIKKLGWYLDLKKRNPKKPLPDYLLKALRFGRVK